jgi:GT2 family glycosyltransferase
VTLNFGSPDDTFDCVRSLLATGYPDLRVIVVDNGSSSEDREHLERQIPPGVVLIQSDTNLGFSGGNNLGIRRALADGAEYVLLINNDAALAADALLVIARAVQAIPDLGILGGKILVANGNGPTSEIWSAGGRWSPLRASGYTIGMGETDRGQYERPAPMEFLTGCMWIVPREVFGTVGLMPEEFFLYGEDLDYCLNVRRAGYRVAYEPRAVCYHKVSGSHWHDRQRASPLLNYYTNRNRILIARRWLGPVKRLGFYAYFLASRLGTALLQRDRSYLAGVWDGLRGRTGSVSPNANQAR